MTFFQSDTFKGKRYENCSNDLCRLVGPSKRAISLNQTFKVSAVFFLFLSILGKVVLCCVVTCKKGKRTTRMKCEEAS